MTNLLKLAERCEKAEKGDRELDADIWEAFGLAPKYDNSKNNYGNWHRKEKGEYHYSDDSTWGENKSAPRYTTSLDAAMTLVPDGWGYQVMPMFCVLKHPLSSCYNTGKDIEAHGRTSPLALCAAALRAHHALINNTVD